MSTLSYLQPLQDHILKKTSDLQLLHNICKTQRGLFKAFFNLERAYFNMRLANNSSDQMSPRRFLGENVSRKLEQKVMEKKPRKLGELSTLSTVNAPPQTMLTPLAF